MTLERRTPLKRGKPLKAKTPLARSTKPLPRESAKRKAERPVRDAVRAAVKERDGGCVAHHLVEAGQIPRSACWGQIETDEIVSRKRRPGGHLDETNCQALCTGINRWKEDKPRRAIELGLARNSWDDRKDPDQ